jgi:hypothetical protein
MLTETLAPTDAHKEGSFQLEVWALAHEVYNEKHVANSVPEQLSNTVQRVLAGVEIPSLIDDPDSKQEKLFTHITKITFDLCNPQNSQQFVDCIQRQMQNDFERPYTTALITSMLNFMSFVDIETYSNLAKQSSGEISILPIQTLAKIVQSEHFTNMYANQEFFREFCNSSDLFLVQYLQIISRSDNAQTISIQEIKQSAPDATLLTTVLLPNLDTQIANGKITLEEGLRSILNTLELYDAKNKFNFLTIIENRYGKENHQIRAIRQRAIELNIIKVPQSEQNEVITQGVQELILSDIKDANDIDFQAIIPEGVTSLLCGLTTGSFGPWHKGHTYSAEVTEALVAKWKKGSPHIDGLHFVAPIPSPKKLAGSTSRYNKNFAQVGSIKERVQCIIATLRQNLKKTFVTTKLQPIFTDDPVDRITLTQHSITNVIRQSFEKAERVVPDINFRRIFGSEKILDKRSDGSFKIKDPEPAFGDIDSIVMGRRGYFNGFIENLEGIREKFPRATIILGPWIPRDSSTLAIETGDFSSISGVAHEIINGYWLKEQVLARVSHWTNGEKVQSVTEIFENLKHQLKINSA